jgi:hypothetical protein
MAAKTPIRTIFTDGVATGLAEFQSGEFIDYQLGGTGVTALGTAGQVLKVNSGATALEWGGVEAILNIEGLPDGTGITVTGTDKLALSDGGTEKQVNISQLGTIFAGDTQTLTNKTISGDSNTLTNIPNSALDTIANSKLTNSNVTVGSTAISLGGSSTTLAGITNLTAGGINITGNSITSADSTIIEMGEGLSVTGNLTVSGDMTVSGTTTSLSTTNTAVTDNLLELNSGVGSNSDDSGIIIERGSTGDNAILMWDESADTFRFGTTTATAASNGNLTVTDAPLATSQLDTKDVRVYDTDGSNYVQLVSPNISGNVTLTLPSTDGDANQILSTDGSGNLSFISATAAAGAGLSNVSDDSSPTLGGDLDVGSSAIVSASNANIAITPNGSGKIVLDGNINVESGSIDLKNAGSVSNIKLYCESSNAHYTAVQSAPHSSYSGNVTLTLPASTDTLVGKATTDTLTNKTIDADNNTLSNIEVDNLKSGVLDTDISSVSASDDTLASAKAVKTYVDAQVTASDLDFSADSGGALSIDLDSETLTFTGGTGIDTTGSTNDVSFAIDSTVATLTGSQTLTNKTLTSPVLNTGISGTAIKDEDDLASDSATHLATQQSIKAYVDAQTTDEVRQDIIGAMLTGNTETLITVTYQDSDGTVDFVVDNNLANYDNSSSAFLTAVPATTNANLIADGTISNTEYQYLNGVSSNIQTQLNTKASSSQSIAFALALG